MKFLAFQHKNGKYVTDWQYSQGYFDYDLSDNILDAYQNFYNKRTHFNDFFKNNGFKLVEVIVDIKTKILYIP